MWILYTGTSSGKCLSPYSHTERERMSRVRGKEERREERVRQKGEWEERGKARRREEGK